MMEIPNFFLHVSIPEQRLNVIENGIAIKSYPVSTAKNGAGELKNSGCTPRGWHTIRAKIGGGGPIDAVFVGRRPTGERYSAQLAGKYQQRDWILTRILWLSGLEPGFNRYREVDTASRYIYIHGSPEHGVYTPFQSHGCIRMTSSDVVDLFDRVAAETRVLIDDK